MPSAPIVIGQQTTFNFHVQIVTNTIKMTWIVNIQTLVDTHTTVRVVTPAILLGQNNMNY
jgi:hypothetical protein